MAKTKPETEAQTSTPEPQLKEVYVVERAAPQAEQKIYTNIVKETKAKLSKQPKVPVFVPKEESDQDGSILSVDINGYRYEIPKGKMMQVPESVAKLVMRRIEGVDFKSLAKGIPTYGGSQVKDYTGQTFEPPTN